MKCGLDDGDRYLEKENNDENPVCWRWRRAGVGMAWVAASSFLIGTLLASTMGFIAFHDSKAGTDCEIGQVCSKDITITAYTEARQSAASRLLENGVKFNESIRLVSLMGKEELKAQMPEYFK